MSWEVFQWSSCKRKSDLARASKVKKDRAGSIRTEGVRVEPVAHRCEVVPARPRNRDSRLSPLFLRAARAGGLFLLPLLRGVRGRVPAGGRLIAGSLASAVGPTLTIHASDNLSSPARHASLTSPSDITQWIAGSARLRPQVAPGSGTAAIVPVTRGFLFKVPKTGVQAVVQVSARPSERHDRGEGLIGAIQTNDARRWHLI